MRLAEGAVADRVAFASPDEDTAYFVDALSPDVRGNEQRLGFYGGDSGADATERKESAMTGKGDFTDEEWELLREGPASAGMIVATAAKGGSFRESFALAKAYAEARKQHGESELLDELVSAGPKTGSRQHSADELKNHGLQRLREAVELLGRKATAQEAEDYRAFVVSLAEKVAQAHEEGGEEVSSEEKAAIADIASSVEANKSP